MRRVEEEGQTHLSTPSEGFHTNDDYLWHIDSIVTWAAPDCHLPPQLQGPQLNMIVGKGAYVVEQPKHFTRLMFELNAPDEDTALERARIGLIQDFTALQDQQPEGGGLPEDLDLHPDRIVVDRLEVRRVVTGVEPIPGAPS